MTETFEEYMAAVGNALCDAQIAQQTLRIYLETVHDLISARVRAHIPYNVDKGKFGQMALGQLIAELARVSREDDPLIAELKAFNDMQIRLNQTILTRLAVADEGGRPQPTSEDITEVAELRSQGFKLRTKLQKRLQSLVNQLKDVMRDLA